ncbi:MAG: DUF3991 domain-containing protein, partial [Xenococcaceae cyanobacterium]
ESKWLEVRKYLTRSRKLPSGLVDELHKEGLVYADEKQNAVFIRRSLNELQITSNLQNNSPHLSPRPRVTASPHQLSLANSQSNEITGATLRGTAGEDNTFKGLAKGTKRSEGWFYFPQGGQSSDLITRAVLVESPIDAMSFAVLDRNDSRRTIYISTDGEGSIPSEFLRQLKDVVVAYDNDVAGNLMAQKMLSQFQNSVRKLPKANDWNEELVNRFNWSKSRRSNEIKRQLQPEQKRERGLSL